MSAAPQPQHEPQDEHQPANLLDRAIVAVSHWLSYLFIFIVAISFYEVLMRYVFNAPTIWVHETASFLGGALFVIGGAYAVATNKHVRVVLIYDYVSDRARAWLNLFHHVMGMLFAGLMTYASWMMVQESWITPWGDIRLETSGTSWNPPTPALLKGLILVIMVTLFIQFALHFVQEIRGLMRKRDV